MKKVYIPTIDPESLRPSGRRDDAGYVVWCSNCGAEESGMNIAEYAEYITGKADECRARLEGTP